MQRKRLKMSSRFPNRSSKYVAEVLNAQLRQPSFIRVYINRRERMTPQQQLDKAIRILDHEIRYAEAIERQDKKIRAANKRARRQRRAHRRGIRFPGYMR